jgi:hypothetical protein
MSAWVIALEQPYFGLTDENGAYEITNVPEGTFTLAVWHEKLKAQEQPVTISANEAVVVDITLSP